MPQTICVFCASSPYVDPVYLNLAEKTGRLIGENGFSLVYGGTTIGLMGAVATTAQENGAHITGVIPEDFLPRKIENTYCDKLICTDGMRERKAMMQELADAFLVLPGGFGTMEEFFEIISQKYLGYCQAPLVLLNYQDFYTPLLTQLTQFVDHRFARAHYQTMYSIAAEPQDAIESIRMALLS
ncbi:TIGR00730 family Rossman fold protein [bacterium]|nr:TIGR00730 family Rossman fold protein [bacterium]